MSKGRIQPSGRERRFDADEIIVSKTDATGRITYVNDVFCRVALYDEAELVGQPHSIIRHPDMPRCVFKLLWDTVERGEEIFAFVKNMAKNGDHYWVLAHVTPTVDAQGKIAVPQAGYWAERLNTDATVYGGTGMGNFGGVDARQGADGRNYLTLNLPPLSTLYLQADGNGAEGG